MSLADVNNSAIDLTEGAGISVSRNQTALEVGQHVFRNGAESTLLARTDLNSSLLGMH